MPSWGPTGLTNAAKLDNGVHEVSYDATMSGASVAELQLDDAQPMFASSTFRRFAILWMS